jgi:hypothetical protein
VTGAGQGGRPTRSHFEPREERKRKEAQLLREKERSPWRLKEEGTEELRGAESAKKNSPKVRPSPPHSYCAGPAASAAPDHDTRLKYKVYSTFHVAAAKDSSAH